MLAIAATSNALNMTDSPRAAEMAGVSEGSAPDDEDAALVELPDPVAIPAATTRRDMSSQITLYQEQGNSPLVGAPEVEDDDTSGEFVPFVDLQSADEGSARSLRWAGSGGPRTYGQKVRV